MAAAQELGDQQTVAVAQQIIPQEEWMAQFLNQNLPMVVREALLKEVTQASS